MQTGPGSSSYSRDGGGGVSRVGLARFRSAPATWLEALLEDEEEDPLKPTKCLTQLLTDDLATSSCSNSLPFASPADQSVFDAEYFRQNSSPPEFLDTFGSISEGYFSNYGIPAIFDSVPPNIRNSTTGNKGSSEVEVSQNNSPKLLSHVKQEKDGVSSSVMGVEMDKIFEDSVPCRVRAKRGFATHPRSIAERVRRTRISDRIRKLQELVPNMDKQTNTADMLDEAVAYVKDLQKQIQELLELQTRCTCSAKV